MGIHNLFSEGFYKQMEVADVTMKIFTLGTDRRTKEDFAEVSP